MAVILNLWGRTSARLPLHMPTQPTWHRRFRKRPNTSPPMPTGCAIRSFVKRDCSSAPAWSKRAASPSSAPARSDPACSGLSVAPTLSSPCVAAASMEGSRTTGSRIGRPDQSTLLTFASRTQRPAGVCKGSWPVPSRGRWSVHVGRRVVPHRPSPAPPSRTLSPNWTLDPLGGGTPPIYWSGAKAGMLSDRDVHHPELAVSGFGNRNAGVGLLDPPPPPAPVRAPWVEAPLESRAAPQPPPGRRAEPRPPNWPAQRRSLLLVGSGVAMPVHRPAPPVSTTFANSAPQGFLWSFAPVSLAGGLLSAVAGFPLCAAFVRRSRFPLLWRWFREPLSEHRVGGRQQEQRVSTPLPQKKKNTERVCGSPLPALPLSLCAGFARRPSWSCLLSVCWCCRCCRHSPSSPLAASEENSDKWRLRL